MLIKCPECELQVSDKAPACPHCGYPLKPENITQSKSRSRKRKRLPSGFGQISEIKGQNLRNRFRVMVTVGKTETGRPIQRTLKPKAYFNTYNEAYQALIEYNKSPYDIVSSTTMNELFEKWSTEHKKSLKNITSQNHLDVLWRYCTGIYDKRVADIKSSHLRTCIETAHTDDKQASAITQKCIKDMFNMMFDYAVEYEMTDKNYARAFKLPTEISSQTNTKKSHICFTDLEMRIMWQKLGQDKSVDIILIHCYTGWRPQELVSLKIENINLDECYMIGGMKTEAGTNRKVPISSKIYDLVRNRYENAKLKGSEYLFTADKNPSKPLPYSSYNYLFSKTVENLNLNTEHRPHDCRVQFVTMMKNAGADEYAIKHIIGHAVSDITEKFYTKRPFSWLQAEIDKI